MQGQSSAFVSALRGQIAKKWKIDKSPLVAPTSHYDLKVVEICVTPKMEPLFAQSESEYARSVTKLNSTNVGSFKAMHPSWYGTPLIWHCIGWMILTQRRYCLLNRPPAGPVSACKRGTPLKIFCKKWLEAALKGASRVLAAWRLSVTKPSSSTCLPIQDRQEIMIQQP